jgi:hypothetical protein
MKNFVSAFICGGVAFGVGEVIEHTVGMPVAFVAAGCISGCIVLGAQQFYSVQK